MATILTWRVSLAPSPCWWTSTSWKRSRWRQLISRSFTRLTLCSSNRGRQILLRVASKATRLIWHMHQTITTQHLPITTILKFRIDKKNKIPRISQEGHKSVKTNAKQPARKVPVLSSSTLRSLSGERTNKVNLESIRSSRVLSNKTLLN